MSNFFDNYLNIKKIMEEKREYKRHMARLEALPEDYRFVYQKIQGHMWQFASGAGYDMMKIHYDLLELFESGAAEGKPVMEITGEDVAAFCDELLRNAETWTDKQRAALNESIHKKLDA